SPPSLPATCPPPSAHPRSCCRWLRTSCTTRSSTTCPNRAPCGSRPAFTPRTRCSPSRTPARSSPHRWFPPLPNRFFAAPNAYAPTTQVSASAWQSSRASPTHTTEPSPSPPVPPAGSASPCNYPPHHRTLADDDQGNCRTAPELRDVHVHHQCPRPPQVVLSCI